MQSRTLLNLGLLVAVTALSLAAWYVYQGKNKEQYLSSLDISQVNTIVIPREHGDIVLHKTQDNWRMEKPYALPAHDFRVQTVLKLLQTPVTHAYDISELDLTQYGLQPSSATIRFNQTEIRFGNANPVNNKRYIQSDNKIYLLNDSLYPLISAEAASFVNLPVLEADATIIKLEFPDLYMAKGPDKLWHDKHKTILADKAQSLLDNWREASAFAVHAYMQREHAKPLTIELANNTTLHFLVFQDKNEFVIGRPDAGVEYHMEAYLADKLLKLPAAAKIPPTN